MIIIQTSLSIIRIKWVSVSEGFWTVPGMQEMPHEPAVVVMTIKCSRVGALLLWSSSQEQELPSAASCKAFTLIQAGQTQVIGWRTQANTERHCEGRCTVFNKSLAQEARELERQSSTKWQNRVPGGKQGEDHCSRQTSESEASLSFPGR